MAKADPIRVLEVAKRGRRAVARDRQLAEDDEAFHALAEAGRDLYEALSNVLRDDEFWSQLRKATAGSTLVPPEQRDALEALVERELPAVLEALRYKPPPPVASCWS
jgi:hypothetical protein